MKISRKNINLNEIKRKIRRIDIDKEKEKNADSTKFILFEPIEVKFNCGPRQLRTESSLETLVEDHNSSTESRR